MGRSFDDVIAPLPQDHRARIDARDAELTQDVKGLRALRQIAGKAQADVAAALKIKQPSVSKIENQADMHISTLRSYVEAVGGELELTVRLPKRPAVRIHALGDVAAAMSEKLTARKASLAKAGDRR
ncbi:MAG: XRE family transcriptional regulator [Hyphomicrobiaceae bacterium]